MCLGAKIGKYDVNGEKFWYMSAELYLKKAIEEVERKWDNLTKMFSKPSLDIPASKGYHPEVDITKELDEDDVQFYQSYIGILRWAVELGRVDLAHVAGAMAHFSACPRVGHMVAVLRVFAYCKKHMQSKLVFDSDPIDFSDVYFPDHEWEQFYPDAEEDVAPLNAPKPRGKVIQVNMFCDAAHATCFKTRRPTTGIIVFLGNAPILWYSKRQNTIEPSTFGSEFVALKIALEMNEGL